jgi:CRP-like cAMP-binding protein
LTAGAASNIIAPTRGWIGNMGVQDKLSEKYSLEFPAGAVLFRAGDVGREMYVIQSGQVRISMSVGEVDKPLAMLGPGEFFGEMSVLTDRPRTATATVVVSSQLLVIEKDKFADLVRQHSELALRLILRLAERLEKTDHSVRILLHREPRARVILGLSDFATRRGESTPEGVLIAVGVDELAEYVGLEPAVTMNALRSLEKLDLVSPAGADAMIVRDVSRMREFLTYLEMKEKYGD